MMTGLAMGTPEYMSPEQGEGRRELTPASDLYSLGVVLYELLTGRTPFRRATAVATAHAHLHDSVPAPRSINPAIPEALEQIVLKCLAKEPSKRFGSARQLYEALASCRVGATEGMDIVVVADPPKDPTTHPGVTDGKLNQARFLAGIQSPGYREAIRQLLETCSKLGLRLAWGAVGTSIRLPTRDRSAPLTIGWLFPSGGVGWMGLSDLTLGYDPASAKQTPSVAAALQAYLGKTAALPGAARVSSPWLEAYHLNPDAVVRSRERIVGVLEELVQVVRGRV